MRKFLLLLLFIAPGPLLAEPWCLVRDAVDSCRFLTADACYAEAVMRGGDCRPNPRELGSLGNAPYCVITAGSRVCKYRSTQRCLAVAREVNGGCVRNSQLDLARTAAGQKKAAGGCSLGDSRCEQESAGIDPGDFGGGGSYEYPY